MQVVLYIEFILKSPQWTTWLLFQLGLHFKNNTPCVIELISFNSAGLSISMSPSSTGSTSFSSDGLTHSYLNLSPRFALHLLTCRSMHDYWHLGFIIATTSSKLIKANTSSEKAYLQAKHLLRLLFTRCEWISHVVSPSQHTLTSSNITCTHDKVLKLKYT